MELIHFILHFSMAEFLDQEAIDKLQYELALAGPKIELAKSAKDKIRLMYFEITKHPLVNPLDSVADIAHLIKVLSTVIDSTNKYYSSFMLLKNSYIRRGHPL